MLDYTFLKIIWWMILGAILIVYACTAGFDSGITMILPFYRKEMDRRILLNISAPTWDGNLTWFVFAGGGMFVVWPLVYSTAFSGMYGAMLIILFSMFFRPLSYDYRSKVSSPFAKRLCDLGLFISSFVPVFMFGVATGNCFVGFPFHFEPTTLRMFYTGNILGLLNPFGLLAGFVSVIMVLMHGCTYAQRRSESDLRENLRRLHIIFAALLLILFTISGILIMNMPGFQLLYSPPKPTITPLLNKVDVVRGAWFASFVTYPWKVYGPLTAYIGTIISVWGNYISWFRLSFWASCFGVGGVIATAGGSLFPFIMPSITNPDQSITVWNATSSQYALNIMLYVGVVLLGIILCYKIYAFYAIWSKKPTLNADDIERQQHSLY